jgi:hypothetical protein
VSSFWIDTDRAWRATSSWAERGDAWFRTQFDLEADFSKLHLNGAAPSALHELAAASTELWVNTSFVRLVIDRVESSDGLGTVDSALIGRLRTQAGQHAQRTLSDACAGSWASYSFSSRYGDHGETFDADVRSPFAIFGSNADERGRNLVIRALADTNDETQIRQDEFELVRLANGSYLVVLPGVTDLSSADLGLNDLHRTVRDVDQYAYRSSQSTSVAENRYARMVWDGLLTAGVPLGAELMIVGHSFGADTALDLAADPLFNGSAGFDVTHVVAAGYHSEPQLPHVDAGTEVLVLQNHRDAAVIAEAVGHGHVTGVVEETKSFFGSVFDLDPLGAVAHLAAKTYHEVGVVHDTAAYLFGNADSIVQVGAGIAAGQPAWVAEGVADMVTIDPGVDQVTEHQIVDVFVGGGQGFGHHPANYVAHVEATTDPGVVAFFESVDAAGYATSGTALAIDVSVPIGR